MSLEKRGDEYQRAVAQVAQSLAPDALIEIGTWVIGPDGRRDLDVVVRARGANSGPLVVIECKDWNRPIGIGFIDALDSKRRDLGATAAMICSNSGFSADALRKAARVGIPTLAALIRGDRRIRVVVRAQIYTRIVEYHRHSPQFHHPRLSDEARAALSAPCYTRDWFFEERSVEAWVASKLLSVAATATKSRSFIIRCRFRRSLEFRFRGIPVEVTGIDIKAAFTVQWMTQIAQIDASQGMYDYLKKVVVFGPGPYQFHVTANSETWGDPVPLEEVPSRLLIPLDQRAKPASAITEMTLGMIKNMPQSDPKDAPNLDEFTLSEEIEDQT
jgi:Restriction endonuclease